MDPVTALRQIAYYKDRAREEPRRVMAYRKAADIVEALTDAQREKLGATNGWQSLPGIGPKTATVISQAWSGREPDALVELRSHAGDLGGGELRAALRGDLHVHSNWSDGSAPIEEMMLAARDLGHEYCALTDHSPRLKIANGLSPERLREQLDVIEEIRETVAPLRILTGIEVDILEDGSLDQEPELLERLNVVVASVHSKLAMDAPSMTRRMLKAVANPHTDVLGHCTGRLVTGGRGTRPESKFDAEGVHRVPRSRHGRRDQLAARAAGSADAAAQPRVRHRVPVQHRHRFARTGTTRLPRLRGAARARRRGARRPHRQHLARRAAPGLDLTRLT